MDSLHIAKSDKTPLIEFSDKGELRIEGRSYLKIPLISIPSLFKWSIVIQTKTAILTRGLEHSQYSFEQNVYLIYLSN